MLVIAHHNISNPDKFWAAAKDATSSLPSNLHIHGVYPSKDRKMGTCIWESDSVQTVQKYLDEKSGNFAKNYCYELNAKEAMGMPALKLDAALAN